MQSNTAAQISTIAAKPILKWAGGKTQMLGELFQRFLLPMDVTLNLFRWRCLVFCIAARKCCHCR